MKLPALDARIPQWDRSDLVDRPCPVCGEPHSGPPLAERPDGLLVRSCGRCGLLYVAPAPSARQLLAFYKNYDRTHRRAPLMSPAEIVRSLEETDAATDWRVAVMASLTPLQGSSVLDIGSGRGMLLHAMKQLGARPHGVDPDATAIEVGRLLGITVYDELTRIEGSTSFDVITMFDLIEHPLEPMTLLLACRERLAARGMLAIWTPGADAVRKGSNPVALRVDLEHMQYFSTQTCAFVANSLGLRIAHLECVGFPALEGIDRPLQDRSSSKDSFKRLLRRMPGFAAVKRFRKRFGAGPRGADSSADRRGNYNLFCIMVSDSCASERPIGERV